MLRILLGRARLLSDAKLKSFSHVAALAFQPGTAELQGHAEIYVVSGSRVHLCNGS